MSYFRVQSYPAADLLDGDPTTTFWSDAVDDVVTLPGKAAARSVDHLVQLVHDEDLPLGADWLLIELEGEPAGRLEDGTVLVAPSEVLHAEPVSERFLAALEAYAAAKRGERYDPR